MRTTATTTSGPVQGALAPAASGDPEGRDVVVFRAIPYAAPPVGGLRWRPPHPPEPWHELRDATRIGPAAPQLKLTALGEVVPDMVPSSFDDDALTVDVWTPGVDVEARPVLVWFHGGAFTIGSGSLATYDGASLAAREDVVVVTCNYRLGVFGYLLLDHPDATANCGILDQIEVLEWVRDNIANFGGDPGRVAVFGESAGGGSVMSLLSTERSEGLFHSAIVQSGASDLVLSRDRALEVSGAIADSAGINVDDLDAWRSLPVDTLLDAQADAARSLMGSVGMMPLHPTVDGDVLTADWIESTRAGVSRDVALLIGTTRNEMALFANFDPTASALDEGAVLKRLGRLHSNPAELFDAYRRTDGADLTPSAAWTAVQTDHAMWAPALRVAEAHARHQPDTWMYRFDWPAADAALGACHGIDIPFPFDTVERVGWETFVADASEARGLARAIQAAWAAMARQGSPGTDRLPAWPRYDAGARSTMILGRELLVESDPRGEIREQWIGRTTLGP